MTAEWTAAADSTVRPEPTLPSLTSIEAAERLRLSGRNMVPLAPPVRLWQRIAGQLRDPMMLVLLVAAALTVATGDTADSVIIALVIVVNTTLGTVQEVRADRAIAALASLAAPRATVVRDGRSVELPAEEIVPGDTVRLADGDVVPADGQLLLAAGLRVDESSLTGEPWPQSKSTGDPDGDRVSAGTTVVHGRGVMTVTATGANSALGRTAAMLGDRWVRTPLQRRLAELSGLLSVATIGICLVVFVLGMTRGQPIELMVVTAVSLAVAAVPESLPAVVTIALALGARRMSRRNALVRRLAAVEALGSVTLLATDKTGTLTEGRMAVADVWAAPGTGEWLGSQGDDAVLSVGALCGDAELTTSADEPPAAVGDPTEAALVVAAADAGSRHDDLAAAWPRVAELPFDSDRRRMTTLHRGRSGEAVVLMKGAPGAVLRPDVVRNSPGEIAGAQARADSLASDGYRVLAVAARRVDALPEDVASIERDMELVGLIALDDPVRVEAAGAVADVRAAGIRPALVTGDHVATARAIARRVGISERDVHARTTPAHKLELIRGWREAGAVVAMTGDGVNDGPALHAADIGVAMGRRGTEVARQAADLVLADDNLDTLVHAVEEGRRVYANIRRFLLYAMAGGVAELAVMLAGPALGFSLTLLPAQILWVNLLTHGPAGVALGAEPAESGVLARGPRPPRQPVLGGGLWQGIATLAAVVAIGTLGAALWARSAGAPWQTLAFFVLATSQLAVAAGVRSDGRGGRAPLVGSVALAGLLAIAGVYVPLLQDLLGTEALPAEQLPVAVVIGLVAYVAARSVAGQLRHR